MTRPRHACRADGPAIATTLASAFLDNPLTRWLLGDEDARQDGYATRLDRWMRFSVETGLAHGHLYSVDGHRAAAVWSAPDSSLFDAPWGQRMAEMLSELLGEAAIPRMKSLAAVTATGHADESHFYLFLLGTHPEARGAGLASSLLEPILAACDAQGLPAHLESSNPRNVPFYERHGFEVVCEAAVAPGGPVIHPMRRAPR